jgi:phosphonate metabolism-associated iron-containing alcohol dehydrogenase
MHQFHMPTKIIFGRNSIDRLDEFIFFPPERILLCTGRQAMKKFGLLDRLLGMLSAYKVKILDNVKPNPEIEDIEAGVEFARQYNPDFIIGLGGGSVLDTAKSIAILVNNDAPLMSYLKKEHELVNRGLPFIAIPTTAGTGSEVTPWATIWSREDHNKYSLESTLMRPLLAIVDPDLTLSLPPQITAQTGLDVLAHAVESYWALNYNPISDVLAIEAIKLVFDNLQGAYYEPANILYREQLALASLLAGMAFSNTKTTASHSISYPLTSYFNIPHGVACVLTLPAMLEFNSAAVPEKTLVIARATGEKTVQGAGDKIYSLIESLGFPTQLNRFGIKREDVPQIIAHGFTPDRVKNNPRNISADEMTQILEDLL